MKYLSFLVKKAYTSQIDENISGWLSPYGKIFEVKNMEHYPFITDLFVEGIFHPSDKAFKHVYGYDRPADYSIDPTREYDMNYIAEMAFFDGWIRFFGASDPRFAGFQGDTVTFEVFDFADVKNLHSFAKRGVISDSVRAIFIDSRAMEYKFRGTLSDFIEEGLTRKQIASVTADFGGDFQNISDIRPDPGNSNPGFNKEYLKQEENFYPRKTSEDDGNGEYVHLHPDHCPRPDLRKLKIVDEDGNGN